MSENATPEEKTEEPTDKRMDKLRDEGQLPMSTEIGQVATLIAGFLVLNMVWQSLLDMFKEVFRFSFVTISTPEKVNAEWAVSTINGIVFKTLPPMAILLAAVGTVAILSVMLQTNWNVKKKIITIKWDMLNPVKGIKRIFSVQGVMNVLKALVKLAIILPIGYFTLRDLSAEMVMLVHLSVNEIFKFTGVTIWDIFWKIMYVLIALAIFDFFWTRFQWLKQNRMTKVEVKDERKSIEGDEETKRKMRAKGLGRIAQRIRESVPQADVIVTNPTHYAVALKYDRDTMAAPMVVAKGKGFLALRIREIAKENGIPILERKLLARSLFAATEVGQPVPRDLYTVVAEVIAYVYRLRNSSGFVRANR